MALDPVAGPDNDRSREAQESEDHRVDGWQPLRRLCSEVQGTGGHSHFQKADCTDIPAPSGLYGWHVNTGRSVLLCRRAWTSIRFALLRRDS